MTSILRKAHGLACLNENVHRLHDKNRQIMGIRDFFLLEE